MHINLWGNGQSKAVGHGWHAGHREHSKDSAKALQQQATQDVVAALRKRLVSNSSATQSDGSATDAPMQTLVTTVRSAMSLRVSGGGDPVPDVLNAVRGALGDARAALVKAGASEDDAGKAIAAVSEQLGAALSAAPPAAATNSPTAAAAAAAAAQAAATPATTTAPATTSSESTLSVNAAASNFLLTYVRKQKASLDILTQEGDQIHILFRTKEAVTASGSSVSNTTTATNQAGSATSGTTTAGAANSSTAGSAAANPATSSAAASTSAATTTASGNAAGSSATTSSTSTNALPAGTSVHAFAAGRVEVSVQGQLSADELKAIGDLVGKVDALATEFFKGDLQQAFNSAAALGFDSSQIAGFALKLSQQESLRQSGALPAAKPATTPVATTTPSTSTTTPVATTPAASTPVAAPVAAPVSEPAPVSTPASPVALDSAATAAATAGTSTDAATTSSSAPVAAGSDAQAASLQDTLGSFLSKVLQTLATPSGGGRLEFSMRWKLSLVVSAVESAAPKSAQGSDAGTSLLTRSLKAVGSLTAMSQAPAAQAPISLAPVSVEPASA